MFGNSLKETYAGKETTPISISGCNGSPYMQELLYMEDKRSRQHIEENYNRQHGYIK